VQKAIEVLMDEHRLIEQVLGSLETFGLEIRAGAPLRRGSVAPYAEFFRGFTDTIHHGKEEDILFQRMVERGFPREAGPLAVMYYEHELGRGHVRGLFAIAEAPDAAAEGEVATLLGHVEQYVPLLRQHIQKEDHILYPMAVEVLTGPELDRLNTDFESFEARLRADGSYDRLRALAERLTGEFRPDPARMAAAAHMPHCGR
jgi:hemerythrin-like domain-containing protein